VLIIQTILCVQIYDKVYRKLLNREAKFLVYFILSPLVSLSCDYFLVCILSCELFLFYIMQTSKTKNVELGLHLLNCYGHTFPSLDISMRKMSWP
jgi:hypothetical protein